MADDAVDVLIVGAGASGLAVAWSLAETRMNILVMEQGGFMNPAEYPSTAPDWELRRFGDFAANPNVRKAPADYPVNDADSPISPVMWNAVGGGTIIYAAHFPRFHPSDFRVRTLDGVADDWPLDYETLVPFFDLNDRIMGVSGLVGNPAYPPMTAQRLPPIPLGTLGNTVAKGFNKLGWHWWPADSAIATEPYEGRAACVNAGPCDLGCAQGAKASTDITYWPLAQRRGVKLRTHCRVREVTVDEHGMADGVLYYDADGALQRQRAAIIVLACNGIGTSRLMLNSKSKHFPDGIANRSGLVGKNLMFHPFGAVAGVFGEVLDGWKGPQGCCITSQEFYETDTSRGFVRGCTFEILRSYGLVSAALGGINEGAPPWGSMHRDLLQLTFGRVAAIGLISEDLPEEHNRVTLDPELTDAHGIPAPKIEYRQAENNKRLLAHAAQRAGEALSAAGALFTLPIPLIRQTGWHLMGTARMGEDPERSVVNAWGRSHDVRNLFVVDGSIFVTSGAVNPTSTIQALALYIADRIKKNLTNLFD